jgi:hypothetical protein
VVISGGDDGTVRVWDLATGVPVGNPFTGHKGAVQSLAYLTTPGPALADAHFSAGASTVAAISSISALDDGALRWQRIAAPEMSSNVLALAWAYRRALVVGAELGIVVFDLPSS